ncbi:MAG: VOC family protein [Polyangiaceae bacterium]
MATDPIPPGYHTLTAQLAIDPAADAIEFYKRAFSAEVVDMAPDPSGKKVWHAALRIGGSMLFVNDVFPEMGGEPSKSSLWVYVPDCDAAFKQAVEAGATASMPPTDMFWGDRMGQVKDPFGQKWTIATKLKDMTPDELKAAQAAFVAKINEKKG